LVVREAARDVETTLVNCLEHVSRAEVSFLVIIIVCIYSYLLSLFFISRCAWRSLRICSKSPVLQSWKRLMPCCKWSLTLLIRS
jgi:hypothetical protein